VSSAHPDFIDIVAGDRALVVRRADAHHCRVEPREADALTWHCELDDGYSNDSERDPASYVRWVCPALRVTRAMTAPAVPDLDVSRAGPQSDLGKLLKGFGRLAGRTRQPAPGTDAEERYVYTDPAGVLDVALRERIESWPSAMHGDGVVRPAELWSIRRTGEGLVVSSSSWWDSAAALDHQIGLAIDVARRLMPAQ
jgi:hypothetical protein